MGESCDPDSMHVLCYYGDDGVTPYFLFFKDGLIEEKVVSVCVCVCARLYVVCERSTVRFVYMCVLSTIILFVLFPLQ